MYIHLLERDITTLWCCCGLLLQNLKNLKNQAIIGSGIFQSANVSILQASVLCGLYTSPADCNSKTIVSSFLFFFSFLLFLYFSSVSMKRIYNHAEAFVRTFTLVPCPDAVWRQEISWKVKARSIQYATDKEGRLLYFILLAHHQLNNILEVSFARKH